MDLDAMDYVRAALTNADCEGLTMPDVIAMAEYAETPEDFDTAVNTLVRTLNG